MFDVVIHMAGKLFGIPATLNIQLLGGPASFTLTSEPVSFSEIWQAIDNEIQDILGVSLPDLSGSPWSVLSDPSSTATVTPTLWISPPGSETRAAALELVFSQPIRIGGATDCDGIIITVQPTIEIFSVSISYEPGQGGVALQATIAFVPTSASPGGSQPHIVSYPFPLPAQGSVGAFRVNYLGLGQRVGPTAPIQGSDPLAGLFQQLETQLASDNPSEILTNLATEFYQPGGGWFVAADISYKGWDLRIVFNDPSFYGLEITAGASPSTPFSGLLLEILYQKLGDNLGVYFGELTLPTAMRRIPLDGFILILPSFSIWLYTNGNFKVNIGWPLGGNSIGLQMDVLTGQAGLYFASLSGADQIASIPSNYDTVLEFGIGFSVSASEAIGWSIFSATVDVTVMATLQGLLAWSSDGPSGGQLSNLPDLYWFAGTASLSLLVQGSVNFSIISAAFSVSASLSAAIAFQNGCATQVTASASVSVSLSITVGFFTISLSFSTTVNYDAVINSGATVVASAAGPNWTIGDAELAHLDRSRRRDRAMTPVYRIVAQGAGFAVPAQPPVSSGGSPKPAFTLYLALQPTILYTQAQPQMAAVVSLVAETPAAGAGSPGPDATGFPVLVQQLVHWLIGTVVGSPAPVVLEEQIRRALAWLETVGQVGGTGYVEFAENLTSFLVENLEITVLPLPMEENASFGYVTPIPILPGLEVVVSGGSPSSVIFDQESMLPIDYPAEVAAYFKALNPSLASGRPAALTESVGIATLVFVDYMLLVGRYVLHELVDLVRTAQSHHERDYLERVAGLEDRLRDGATPEQTVFDLMDAAIALAPSVTPAQLLSEVLASFDYAAAAGVAARFMLHGLQLPLLDALPVNAIGHEVGTISTQGLYALTGQLIPVSSESEVIEVTLGAAPAVSGLPCPVAFASPSGVTVSLPVPSVLPSSPVPIQAPAGETSPPPGSISLAAMPAVLNLPLTLTLGKSQAWSADTSSTSVSTIFSLTATLLQLIRDNAGATLFLSQRGGAGSPTEPLVGRAALAIPVSLQQVVQATGTGMASSPGQGGGTQVLPHVYQVGGTDEATRDLLYLLLQDPSSLNGASFSLLYSPPGGGALSQALSPATLLVKTNLTTIDTPGSGAATVLLNRRRPALFESGGAPIGAAGPVSATLSGDPYGFLQLVWELSVVQAPGYYLYYATDTLGDLPADLFSDTAANQAGSGSVPLAGTSGGVAALTILIELSETTASPSFSSPALPAYLNSVILDGVTDHQVDATVQIGASPATVGAPTCPPGSVGFLADWTAWTDAEDAPIPVNILYHLLQYRLLGSKTYNASGWSLPVAPGSMSASPGGTWRFQQTLPLANFLAGQSNPYGVVGEPATLQFQIADIYGNAAAGDSPLEISVLPLYSDPLCSVTGWPGAHLFYSVERGSSTPGMADLTLRGVFDLSALLPDGGSPYSDAVLRNVNGLIAKYELIRAQLTDPNVVATLSTNLLPDTVPAWRITDQLAAFAGEILVSIKAFSRSFNGDAAMSPVVWQNDFPIAYDDIVALTVDIIPLTVSVTVARPKALVDALALENLPAALLVTAAIPPDLSVSAKTGDTSPDGPQSQLRRFAIHFESAFAGFDGGTGKLLLAQRAASGAQQGGAGAVPSLWVVRWSAVSGLSVQFGNAPPPGSAGLIYFGLAPLSTVPMSGTIGALAYSNIDLDAWALQFLTAVDGFLTPEIAVSARLLDEANQSSCLDSILQAKAQLAAAIVGGVDTILDSQAGEGDIAQARAGLQQALLTCLSDAYRISTIVLAQVDVTIAGTSGGDPEGVAPSLYGTVSPNGPVASDGAGSAQQFAFSNAELPLSATSPGQWMPILVTVSNPLAQKVLDVPLYYNIPHLQYDVDPNQESDDYTPSSWLKFVLPNQDELCPMIAESAPIPIPLSFEPDLPVLLNQAAAPQPPGSGAVGDIVSEVIESYLSWDYTVTVQHAWTEQQDQFLFDAAYDGILPPGGGGAGGTSSPALDALFRALGAFIAAYPDIAKGFPELVANGLGATATGTPQASFDLLQQFAALVCTVADAWTALFANPPEQELAAQSGVATVIDSYCLGLSAPASPDALTIELAGNPAGRDDQPPSHWPTVNPVVPVAVTTESSGASPDGPKYFHFIFDSAPVLTVLDIMWSGLSLASCHTVQFRLAVRRNASLIETEATNPAFIYQTSSVQFANSVIPLVTVPPIPTLPAGNSLVATLSDIFDGIQGFAYMNVQVQVVVSYSYPVWGMVDMDSTSPLVSPMASSPVLLANDLSLDQTPALGLAAAIRDWLEGNTLPTSGSVLSLNLTVSRLIAGQMLPVLMFQAVPFNVEPRGSSWWNSGNSG
ncbi:hypothetical protein [Azospirillum sp. B506]|uniref:hypothetical protein n=1 Tax=Azospirillum sp. B506 TaxID=137721 RepID=UPI000346B79D|nr:hypothetical protein [Azospirillum sp. B506]